MAKSSTVGLSPWGMVLDEVTADIHFLLQPLPIAPSSTMSRSAPLSLTLHLYSPPRTTSPIPFDIDDTIISIMFNFTTTPRPAHTANRRTAPGFVLCSHDAAERKRRAQGRKRPTTRHAGGGIRIWTHRERKRLEHCICCGSGVPHRVRGLLSRARCRIGADIGYRRNTVCAAVCNSGLST